jgi:hypothetical protein
MKRLAFLSFTIAALIGPIQVQGQTRCVMFPQNPNPEAELQFLLSHPDIPVCPSPHPDLAGQARALQEGATQRAIDTQRLMCSMSGRVC